MIIGILSILGLLGEIFQFEVIRFVLESVIVVAFFSMCFFDSKNTRGLFFVCFLLGSFLIPAVDFFVASGPKEGGVDLSPTHHAESIC